MYKITNLIYYLIMNYIITLSFILTTFSKPSIPVTSVKDDINNSIIEGFYNNDTIGKSHLIYLIN